MALFNMGGGWWSPALAGWGRAGRKPSRDLSCYYAGKLNGTKGRLSAAEIEAQTLDVWNVPAVYALFNGDQLIYVGKATALGERLLAHWRQDHLVGRWDAFSWVSPVEPQVSNGNGKVSIPSAPGELRATSLDDYLKQVEAFGMLFGVPAENRQEADFGPDFWWLEQIRSPHADLTPDEMIAELHARLMKPEG